MKVKIKRVRGGSMGDQRQYGLVTGSIWNYENKQATNNVGTTLSPVPRDEATIEAEKGETVVGDLDNDGMVEHAKIGGKRHSQGGTPLNVPDGSFVFSDYRGLLIKNKDLLKGIFNMSTNKAVTPAKVAQRYEINKYKALLNDPESDAMTKKTAQLMIDNNMKKLGQLALVQEGMKGFPDGIPAIALPLLGSDFKHPQGPQMMKKGGTLRRAQDGEERKWMTQPGSNFKYEYLTLDDLERKIGHPLEIDPYNPGVFQDPGDPNIPAGIRRPGSQYIADPYTGGMTAYFPGAGAEGKLPKDYHLRSYYESQPNFKYWKSPDGERLDNWQSGAVPHMGPRGDAGLIEVLTLTGGLGLLTKTSQGLWNLGKWSINALKGKKTAETAAKAAEAAADAQKVAGALTDAQALAADAAALKASEDAMNAAKAAGKSGREVYQIGKDAYLAALQAAAEGVSATAEGAAATGQGAAAAEAYTRWQQAKDIYAGSPLLRQLLPWAGVAGGLGIIDATTNLFSGPQQVNPTQTSPANPIGNPSVPPLADTGKIAKAQADSFEIYNIFKQLYPTASDEDIKKMMRDPIQYNIADTMFRKAAVVDSNKLAVDSNKVLTNYSAADSAAQAQAAAAKAKAEAEAKAQAQAQANKKKKKVIRIRTTGRPTRLTKEEILRNKSKKLQEDYIDGYKFGGSLDQYADRGETNTQYRKESQITSNDDYDVIPVSQDIDYSFGKQIYDPNLGTYTIIDPDTNRSIELDLNDFMNRQGDLLDEYDGKRDKWLTDVKSRDEATRKKAAGWFQRRYDKWREENGLPKYFFGESNEYTGYDDKFGIYTFSAPGIKKKVKKPETKTEKQPEETPEEEVITAPKVGFQSPTGYGLGQWFPSDQAAMIAAAGMKIPDYHAYYGLPNPSLMSPVYRNENYEPIGAVTQTVEGMGTGPEARASALGVTGKGLKAASDIQQQTEALNTDQFLKTQAANVQNINQFTMLGEKEKSDYMNSINAIAKENAMNQNAKDAGFASAFGKGYNNVLNQMLINAQYPYQFQTPYSVAVNPTLKSIYDTPLTGSGSGVDYNDAFDYYYKLYSDPNSYGLNKKEAIDAANTAARNYLNSIYQRNRGTGTNGAILSPFQY